MKKGFTALKAFSLIEISIVLIIIGILIAGVTQASRLIKESRLKMAQTMTQSSPVNSLRGLSLWFETSLDNNFLSAEAVDQATITIWNDVNPQNSYKYTAQAAQKNNSNLVSYNSAAGGTILNSRGPTYIEDGINNIPTLRFTNNGSTAYRYLTVDKAMRNLPRDSMTLFVVIKYRSGVGFIFDRTCTDSAGSVVLCSSSANGGSSLFGLEITTGNALRPNIRPDGSASAYFPSLGTATYLPGYTLSAGRNYIITLERKYNNSFITYVNGTSSYNVNSSKADDGQSINMDPIKIGRHAEFDTNNTLDFDVSEVIFVCGPLKQEDRFLVEDYLGKKYNIGVNHN